MFDKREDAVSPVIAVVLLLLLGGVIVGIAGYTVLSNVDNILINDVKTVSVTVQISGNDVAVYPVSGKDLASLEYYTVYFLGENEIDDSEPIKSTDTSKVTINPYNKNIVTFNNVFEKGKTHYINIVGHFADGSEAVILMGKIDNGLVVVPVSDNPSPAVGKNKYNVVLNANGGGSFAGEVTKTLQFDKWTTHPTSEFDIPTQTGGGSFTGWYNNPECTGDSVTSVTEGTTLYAKWTVEVTKYSVKYYGNGETGGSVPIDSNSEYTSGSTVTVLGNTGNLVKESYVFAGWTDQDGESHYAGSTFTINKQMMLYAKWTDSNGFYDWSKDNNYDTEKLAESVNTWAKEFYGDPNLVILYDKGDHKLSVMSDKPIVISGNPITINYKLNIEGPETLNLISAPGYTGSMLKINSGDNGFKSNANIVVNGNDINGYSTVRIDSLVVSNGVFDIESCEVIIKNGNKNGNQGGGGFINQHELNIKNGGTLIVQDNTATNGNGGGILNNNVITVNNGGTLKVLNNKATCDGSYAGKGGGIYLGNKLEIKNGGIVTVSSNEAINGGGIYNNNNLVNSGTLTISGNTAPTNPQSNL